jgi:hypothetical protein
MFSATQQTGGRAAGLIWLGSTTVPDDHAESQAQAANTCWQVNTP